MVPVRPSRLVTLSSSSLFYLPTGCRPYLLCTACMCCLFGPPDWSVCHPVASSTCLQVQALLALYRLHVLPVWPSRLVSLSSSSPLLLAYRCRPYLLCAACMCYLFGPPDWSLCHPVALFYLPTGAGPTCSACLTGQLSPGCGQHSVHHSCSIQLGCQAWCSKDACTVQRFRYMQHERLCLGNTHTYTCNSQSGSSSAR